MSRADVLTTSHGSIWTFYPKTAKGKAWIDQHLGGEAFVDHRCGYEIAIGMLTDGLQLQDTRSGAFAQRPAERAS